MRAWRSSNLSRAARKRVRAQPIDEQSLERGAQFIALSGVAQIELARAAGVGGIHPFGGELVARLRFQLPEAVLGVVGGDLGERAKLRADVIVHHVGAEEAEGGERAGARRDENAPHAEFLGHRRGVYRAGTPERQQREGGQIDAALGGKDPHFVGHAHVDNALDAGGGFDHVHMQGIGDVALQRRARRTGVERLRAAEEVIGVEVAAYEVGVGDRGPGTAASIAGRPRIGAGALRPDIEEAAAVDPGDRAAAGGDRRHVERGYVDLPARDHPLGDFERHPAFDEGDVGAGAAHVEGHKAAPRVLAREIGARLRAGGGAGKQRMHGVAAGDRRRKRHHAAVRLHQKTLLGPDPVGIQTAVEMTDVVHHDRLEISVEQRRREPRPFADARQHLARQRDVDGGIFGLDQRARFLLVRGIHEREQVADRDRLDAGALELARGAADRLAVERHEHPTGVVAALGNFPGEALGRDGGRLRIEVIEQISVARLALDFLHSSIALGDEQSDLGAAHFQQRIGGDGGAVGEKTDLVRRNTSGDQLGEPVEHAERGILRRARDLLDRKLARFGVEQHEIGMGAADVDAETIARLVHVGLRVANCAGVMPAQAGIQQSPAGVPFTAASAATGSCAFADDDSCRVANYSSRFK